MTAEAIAKALGGRKAGGGWTARCPAHDDRTPSLSIRDADENMVLVRCHAGCDQERVIAALRGRGLWGESGRRSSPWTARRKPVEPAPDRDDARRTEMALAIWQSATPAPRTPVATYLGSRGIHLPPSDALRFHAGLKHPSGGFWPGDGGACDERYRRSAHRRPSHLPRPRWRRDSAPRSAEDDARPVPGRCGSSRRTGRCAHGRGRHRDVPRRHAGERPFRMGGAFDIWPALSRSTEGRARRDRAGRWRRGRRSGGTGLRPALEAPRSARAHRPPAARHGLQRHAVGPCTPH